MNDGLTSHLAYRLQMRSDPSVQTSAISRYSLTTEVAAAVLLPTGLIVLVTSRLLFTEANRFDIR